jgi:septal ring factor EnvC (AmiA/AmiB activator)
MLNYFEPQKYITRTKRKKSNKHQEELSAISKKAKVLEKKLKINQKKMKPYEDKLQPFLNLKYKLEDKLSDLENKRLQILEKYEYEVLNPEYENPEAY